MKITINGVEHEVDAPLVSYEHIIGLAGERPGVSVIYVGPKHFDNQRAGILTAGRTVRIEEGMKFDAIMTGNA